MWISWITFLIKSPRKIVMHELIHFIHIIKIGIKVKMWIINKQVFCEVVQISKKIEKNLTFLKSIICRKKSKLCEKKRKLCQSSL